MRNQNSLILKYIETMSSNASKKFENIELESSGFRYQSTLNSQIVAYGYKYGYMIPIVISLIITAVINRYFISTSNTINLIVLFAQVVLLFILVWIFRKGSTLIFEKTLKIID